jgi:hypothetical protein
LLCGGGGGGDELAACARGGAGRARRGAARAAALTEVRAGAAVRQLGDAPESVDEGVPRRAVRAKELAHVLEEVGVNVVEAEEVHGAVAEDERDRAVHARVAVCEDDRWRPEVLFELRESPNEGLLRLTWRDLWE